MPQETMQEQTNRAILAELARLGGNLVTEDALRFAGNEFVFPASMDGDVEAVIHFLQNHIEQQEESHAFSRTFKYRPSDGAHATYEVLRKVWGTTGFGRPTVTMFGTRPPEFITIDKGVNEQVQVPSGRVAFPPLQAVMTFTATSDDELGMLFHLIVQAPRKFRGHIEGLFRTIEDELKNFSIYKGKAITGSPQPMFIDTSKVDPARVIYSDQVMTQLEANIWAVLRHGEAFEKIGLTRKRAVLLEGPFGTGKTLAAYLTAQEAEKAGWTFVFCRPGQDDLKLTMQTALLYAPAVVFFEDIDVVAENGDPEAVSTLLDIFDGIGAKNQDLVAVLTTNHVERIHKAMLRPGRLDAVVHIAELDKNGIIKLIKSKVPAAQLGDVNYDDVAEAFFEFLPSFAAEAIDRAIRYQIVRTNGVLDVLHTEDFVAAADGLRPQLEMMNDATEGTKAPLVDQALRNMVREAVHGSQLLDSDGDVYGTVQAELLRKP